ncbi:MAG: hypothetical protein ACKVE3_01960 [Dissulfuribacterales bacterium]
MGVALCVKGKRESQLFARRNQKLKSWEHQKSGYIRISQTSISFVYTIVLGDSIISHGYKTGRDLRWNIKVAHHEKNDVRKGIRCMKKC